MAAEVPLFEDKRTAFGPSQNVTVWLWGFGRRPIATVGRAPGPSSKPFKSQVRPEFTDFPTFRNRADSTYTGAVGHVVDGSGLARVFFTRAAVVGAAKCSAC